MLAYCEAVWSASIKVAYSFDFGRKTQKVEKDVNKNINSSLLRVE